MAAAAVPPALQLPWGTTPEGRPVTLTPTALEFLQLLSTGGGSGAVLWSSIIGIPANVTALAGLVGGIDKLPYFIFGGTMAVTDFTSFGRDVVAANSAGDLLALISPLFVKGDLWGFAGANTRVPVGPNGYVLTADSVAAVGVSWQPGGGGGAAPPFHPLTFYGAVENGVTDDAAAITAWLADATQHTVWIEGVVANSLSTPRLLNKRAQGVGNYHFTATGDYVPAAFVWITTSPTRGVLPSGTSNYNFSGDLSHVDARYTILGRLIPGGNLRKSLSEVYYETTITPHWEQFNNLSGYSGGTCFLTVAAAAGSTGATVNSTDGITTGDILGFFGPAGSIAEQRAVTVTSSTTLTWTGGLANNYPIHNLLTLGLRTMDPISYMELNHFGGGDAYAIVAVVGNGYQRTAGQDHWVMTSTVGLFGGSASFSGDVLYATGIEMQYVDNGHNVTVIADVQSFPRTNDTQAHGVYWGRDWSQSTGISVITGLACPIDCFYTMGGWARVAFDTSRLNLIGQTADPAVQPAFQTALGHRWYMNSTVTAGGRGTDPNGIFAAMYGNTPGDIYIGSGNDGTSDFIDVKIDRVGGSRMRVRPDSINFNNAVNFGSQIHVAGNLILPSGGYFHNIGAAVYWFNGTTDTLVAP
jgi:hypothetical protein